MLTSRHINGHGIHSPFVYKLISELFQNKVDLTLVNRVEKYRSRLKLNDDSIIVSDLGAGSLKMSGSKRKVSQIARNSAVRKKYGRLLSSLAATANGRPVLELGTSLGISTMYMALSAPDSIIYTIEGCDECADIAEKSFIENNINNVKLYRGNFDNELELVLNESGIPAMVFIDGNHRMEPLLRYFEIVMKYASEDTILVLDDIYYSREMESAWEIIKGDDRVKVCIDVRQFGLVFLQKGLSKENFIIRY